MITIDANERFTEMEIFEMFNIDMVAAGAMDASDVRGDNRFLLKRNPHNEVEKSDPASVSVKFSNGEMTGTTARMNRLQELCEKFDGVDGFTTEPEG